MLAKLKGSPHIEPLLSMLVQHPVLLRQFTGASAQAKPDLAQEFKQNPEASVGLVQEALDPSGAREVAPPGSASQVKESLLRPRRRPRKGAGSQSEGLSVLQQSRHLSLRSAVQLQLGISSLRLQPVPLLAHNTVRAQLRSMSR